MSGETTVEFNLGITKTLKNPLERFRDVKTFVFDVDGVMTDGKVLVLETGEHLRTYSAKDGYAIRRALEEGYNVCIITGGVGGSIDNRMKKLKVTQYYTNAEDKVPVFKRYCEANNINPSDVLYMGDDLNDYQVMHKVGLATCPVDACVEIQGICHYVSPIKGGDGCVRDVIEKVMRVHQTWMKHLTVSG
jgi:3-deoxy-D-manno-octulosonate 8-phosphate phosphatase (KDO 8-P phosphatase)